MHALRTLGKLSNQDQMQVTSRSQRIMKTLSTFLVLLASSLSSLQAWGAHPFLCCDYNGGKVAVVSADGKVEWEYACKNPQDCWRLASGNYLICFVSGAVEINPTKQVLWEYKAPDKTEVH